jgi:hypothetical protein
MKRLLPFLFLTVVVAPACAQEWRVTFSPYFWAAGLSGEVGQFDLPPVHLDASFDDIRDDLDFSIMAIVEARRQRFSLLADVAYTKTSTGRGTPLGLLASRVDVKTETTIALFAAGYSLWQRDHSHLDLVAGVRVWDARTELSYNGGVLDGRAQDDSARWADGVLGLRGRHFFTERLYVAGWGLIGSGEAERDWDLAALLGYQISDRLAAVVGYRALGVDYAHNDFLFDIEQKGPVLGLVHHF